MANGRILTIPRGQTATVVSRHANGWIQLDYRGSRGWSNGRLFRIQKIQVVEPAPGQQPPPAQTVTTATANYAINMRRGPGVSNGRILTIPRGQTATVVSRHANGWIQIDYRGTRGWSNGRLFTIRTQTVTQPVPSTPQPPATPTPPPSTPQPTTVTTATANYAINMRRGPGVSNGLILTIPRGQTATVVSRHANGWIQLDYRGSRGWSNGRLFSIRTQTVAAPTTPQATPTPAPAAPVPAPKPAPGGKYIALTFDDGPSAHTPRLLDALRANNAKATFFVIGSLVGGRESTLRRMVNEGHEIGNHTYGHPDLRRLSRSGVSSQITSTDNRIRNVTGVTPRLMRPPYGSRNNTVMSVAGSTGKAVILWSVDTNDWRYRNSSRLVNYILNNAKDGDIILMHDSHATTVNGVISVLPLLRARGFTMVTVSQLMAIKGKSLRSGAAYSHAR